MQHATPTATAASWMRAGLLGFAAASLALGLLLLLSPGVFYDALANFGPRNDHDLRDMSAFYLASAPALAIAAGRPSWRAPVLALVAVQYGLHAINHVFDAGSADPSWVGAFDAASLIAATVLLAALLRAALRREGSR